MGKDKLELNENSTEVSKRIKYNKNNSPSNKTDKDCNEIQNAAMRCAIK